MNSEEWRMYCEEQSEQWRRFAKCQSQNWQSHCNRVGIAMFVIGLIAGIMIGAVLRCY